MKNKLVQNSLFVGITVALFVGALFGSSDDNAFSQNTSDDSNIDRVTDNNASNLTSSSLDKEGNWTDDNASLTVAQ